MQTRPPALALVLFAAVALSFGGLNAWNARQLFPHWAQDLAFFTQLVHGAASGGGWSSPLLFEPEGFFAMVHTHLVLPLIVAAWLVLGRQEVLLFAQGAFGALALWPAWQLGAQSGGRAHAWAAVLAVACFGPMQAVATADFRPAALFVPGVLGVFAAAWRRDRLGVVLWACLANLGRQEGAFLVAAAGAGLMLVPFGMPRHGPLWRRAWDGLRLREGALALGVSALWLLFWAATKPTLFFHVQPALDGGAALAPDILANRTSFAGRLAASGAALGLLSPAGLVAGLPIAWQMATNPREWGALTGPAAHYHAFWLPFVLASAIPGAARLRRFGGPLLVLGLALPFAWAVPRTGPVEARGLESSVSPHDRVAADDFVIHRYAGRAVLWNTRQVEQPPHEKPRLWPADEWPIPLSAVDVVVARDEDPLVHRAESAGWLRVDRAGSHVLLRPPPARRAP
ncbi:MAG: hypothetical protein VX265_09665 [Myxococcota bacterium]|nr:hypothetical protein [Myxococcota bacterium]